MPCYDAKTGALSDRKEVKTEADIRILYTIFTDEIPTPEFQILLGNLPDTARDKILRFHFRADVYATLNGFRLLSLALDHTGLDGNSLLRQVKYDGIHKPLLDFGKTDFNISHSGEIVICALAMNCLVGIDIERIADIAIEDFNNCWCPEEKRWLESVEEKRAGFYYLWTRKEAVIKAFGKGLSYELNRINVLADKVVLGNEGTWFLKSFYIGQEYMAAVAADIGEVPDITPVEICF